ncbi:hypothetical protein F4806DRAFT_472385 [Annulohypoxylon nitens]|nr:hypothetical protein F4806DRAFT_472385 [Annulohypoxylon nitens]
MFFRSHKDSPSSSSKWVNSILRQAYQDGHGIKEGLNEIFGVNQYKLTLRNGRWVIWAPRKLTVKDESKIESFARVHYRP